jgi:hypothetical protein
MSAATPLYYARLQSTIDGLAFSIGTTVLFAPVDSQGLHLVDDVSLLTITAEVPDLALYQQSCHEAQSTCIPFSGNAL